MSNATQTSRTPAIDATINEGTLTLTFSHGQTLRVYSDDLTPEIRQAALMHGLKQKLVDAAAIARNTETGATATVEDKYDAVREVFDRLIAGEWNKRREAGGGDAGLFLSALARIRGVSTDVVEEFLKPLSDEQKKALKANPKVVAAMGEIRTERAARTASKDSDELLASLG